MHVIWGGEEASGSQPYFPYVHYTNALTKKAGEAECRQGSFSKPCDLLWEVFAGRGCLFLIPTKVLSGQLGSSHGPISLFVLQVSGLTSLGNVEVRPRVL